MIIKIKKNHWFNNQIQIVDDAKNVHNCLISTCQRHHHENCNFSCFWCRLSYKGSVPIHCPMKYHPTQIEKKLPLKIVKGNVEDEPTQTSPCLNAAQIIKNSYYEVDGSFCSASCCLAYILDKKHDVRFSESEMLLHQMTNLKNITPSPHWRLLEKYGGPYSKKQYMELVQNNDTFHYHSRLLFINHMFEKNLFQ